jgi:hypothetical protein
MHEFRISYHCKSDATESIAKLFGYGTGASMIVVIAIHADVETVVNYCEI